MRAYDWSKWVRHAPCAFAAAARNAQPAALRARWAPALADHFSWAPREERELSWVVLEPAAAASAGAELNAAAAAEACAPAVREVGQAGLCSCRPLSVSRVK
jgi:hypothetical protein